jgi:hypothetical protein
MPREFRVPCRRWHDSGSGPSVVKICTKQTQFGDPGWDPEGKSCETNPICRRMAVQGWPIRRLAVPRADRPRTDCVKQSQFPAMPGGTGPGGEGRGYRAKQSQLFGLVQKPAFPGNKDGWQRQAQSSKLADGFASSPSARPAQSLRPCRCHPRDGAIVRNKANCSRVIRRASTLREKSYDERALPGTSEKQSQCQKQFQV